MQLDQLPHQRQADSQTPFGAAQRGVGLCKQVQHAWQHLLRQTRTVIAHADHGLVAFRLDAEDDRTTYIRVLGRVVQQVGQDLLQADEIAFDEKVGPYVGVQCLTTRINQRLADFDGAVCDHYLRRGAAR